MISGNDAGLHYSDGSHRHGMVPDVLMAAHIAAHKERPNAGFTLPAPKRRAMVNQRANRYREATR